MDTTELEQFFTTTWAEAIKKHKSSPEYRDSETVNDFTTWESAVIWLHRVGGTVALIRPALGHLNMFARFFQANLAPSLDASYL
ncbi:hypothetical protein QQZ08_000536 [Neonectria magnoliae]|uniref:Uncharacterized protein n=1 Tax=Neonectria magnoliae TaxID=2732573 RepID=A0ABR1IHD6_9HYPO